MICNHHIHDVHCKAANHPLVVVLKLSAKKKKKKLFSIFLIFHSIIFKNENKK